MLYYILLHHKNCLTMSFSHSSQSHSMKPTTSAALPRGCIAASSPARHPPWEKPTTPSKGPSSTKAFLEPNPARALAFTHFHTLDQNHSKSIICRSREIISHGSSSCQALKYIYIYVYNPLEKCSQTKNRVQARFPNLCPTMACSKWRFHSLTGW